MTYTCPEKSTAQHTQSVVRAAANGPAIAVRFPVHTAAQAAVTEAAVEAVAAVRPVGVLVVPRRRWVEAADRAALRALPPPPPPRPPVLPAACLIGAVLCLFPRTAAATFPLAIASAVAGSELRSEHHPHPPLHKCRLESGGRETSSLEMEGAATRGQQDGESSRTASDRALVPTPQKKSGSFSVWCLDPRKRLDGSRGKFRAQFSPSASFCGCTSLPRLCSPKPTRDPPSRTTSGRPVVGVLGT